MYHFCQILKPLFSFLKLYVGSVNSSLRGVWNLFKCSFSSPFLRSSLTHWGGRGAAVTAESEAGWDNEKGGKCVNNCHKFEKNTGELWPQDETVGRAMKNRSLLGKYWVGVGSFNTGERTGNDLCRQPLALDFKLPSRWCFFLALLLTWRMWGVTLFENLFLYTKWP